MARRLALVFKCALLSPSLGSCGSGGLVSKHILCPVTLSRSLAETPVTCDSQILPAAQTSPVPGAPVQHCASSSDQSTAEMFRTFSSREMALPFLVNQVRKPGDCLCPHSPHEWVLPGTPPECCVPTHPHHLLNPSHCISSLDIRATDHPPRVTPSSCLVSFKDEAKPCC